MDGQTIALFVIGILLTCIGALIAGLVLNATQTFKDKINDLTDLYGKTLEELKEINKIVLKHEIKLETHEVELDNLKQKC
jgi:hypothetical protein